MCKVGESGSLLNVESKEADFEGVSWRCDVPQNTQHYTRSCTDSDLQKTAIPPCSLKAPHVLEAAMQLDRYIGLC